MYMDALESEVEALGAEVTRLRLMLHRVSQVMELPTTTATSFQPSGTPVGRAQYVDPMRATLGADGEGRSSAAPPTLEALEHILRAYPVELLEMLAKQRTSKHRGGWHSSHSRQQRRSARSPSSSSAGTSSTSSSRSPSTSTGSYSENRSARRRKSGSKKSRNHEKATLRGTPNNRRERNNGHDASSSVDASSEHVRRSGDPYDSPDGNRRKAKEKRHRGHRMDAETPSAKRTSSDVEHGIPAALMKQRRSTVAKQPSEAPPQSQEVSQSHLQSSGPQEKSDPSDTERSLSQRRGQGHVSLSSDALQENATHATVHDMMEKLYRQQKEKEKKAIDGGAGDDSSSEVSPPQPSRGGVPPFLATNVAQSVESLQRPEDGGRSGKEVPNTTSQSSSAPPEESTEAEMSYVSMSAMNEMLRFHSHSPAEQQLHHAASGLGVSIPGASAQDKTLRSQGGAGEESSFYNYSAFNYPLQGQDSATSLSVAAHGTPKRKGSGHVKVLTEGVDDPAIDHQHSRSHLMHHASNKPSSSARTPLQESHYAMSDAHYSYSAFGSIAASAQSLGEVPQPPSHEANSPQGPPLPSASSQALMASQPEIEKKQKRTAKLPVPTAHAMRPPSSEASTTEDGSGVYRTVPAALNPSRLPVLGSGRVTKDDGELVFGGRKPIPVTSGANAVNTTPADAGGLSPTAYSRVTSPGAKAGVRTPHATRSVLQRIREAAEDSSDDTSDSSDGSRGRAIRGTRSAGRAEEDEDGGNFAKTVKQQVPVRIATSGVGAPGSAAASLSHHHHHYDNASAADTPKASPPSSQRAHQRQPSMSFSQSYASPAAEHQSPSQPAGNSFYQPGASSPMNPSMSYTGADQYSLGLYTPQYTPAQPSVDASASQLAHRLQAQHSMRSGGLEGIPSALGSQAYDYDFGFSSRAATPQQQQGPPEHSPGSAGSPLSWMPSRSDIHGQSVDTHQLMADGGYMFDY